MISARQPPNRKELYAELLYANPDAMVIVGFEDAYMGMTALDHAVAIYDYDECVRILSEDRDCQEDEAEFTLISDILSGCVGINSPIFARSSR